jgi:hypothetical protein
LNKVVTIIETVISETLSEKKSCQSHKITRECDVQRPEGTDPEDVALAVATRCWSTYITFFGDSQQLSCTTADTCRKGRLEAGNTVCAACPMPEPGILAFACDHITKLCTCGVPQRRDTFCTANEDCELADASCRSLSAGLELSGTDIPCSSCSSRGVCFRATAGAAGLCACSAGLRDNLHRCAPRAKYEFLLLHFDRLCLWHRRPVPPPTSWSSAPPR